MNSKKNIFACLLLTPSWTLGPVVAFVATTLSEKIGFAGIVGLFFLWFCFSALLAGYVYMQDVISKQLAPFCFVLIPGTSMALGAILFGILKRL